MKFIGQYIQSLIARFRNDVYLEKVASDSVEGSPDSDTFLALKSGKVVRTAGGGSSGGITFSGSTANGLVTFGDASTANVESNLTYDSSAHNLKLKSGLTGFPAFEILTDNEGINGGQIKFSLETQSLANLDQLGKFAFTGGTGVNAMKTFTMFTGNALHATSGSEAGRLDIRVLTNGSTGGLQNGIRIDGSNSSTIVNTIIGTGATSLTTVAGDLQVNGNDIKDDDGTTCITFDSSGNTTIQNDLTVGAQADGDATLIISADTDNGTGEEGDNARLWFKQDGDITEGAIQMSSNVLNIINNISGAGGISFQTGTTNNTGTTDPSTGATERMSIASDGTITVANNINANGNINGDGSTDISGIDHIIAGSANFTTQLSSDNIFANNNKAVTRTNKVGTAASSVGGLAEIITEGTVDGGGNLIAGRVYYLMDDATTTGTPSWRAADATTASTSTGLLAIALGTSPLTGMLLRGMVVIDSSVFPNSTPGTKLFLRDSSGGRINVTPPSTTGRVQRILGHYIITTGTTSHSLIHFNPSQEFITIA